jgi:hypothetical protein
MKTDPNEQPLRLRKKHGSGAQKDTSAADGQIIVDGQSIRNAVVVGLIVVLIFSAFWVALTELTNRIYPWFTVVLGCLLGYSTRLGGRGTDWRFPLLASLMTLLGSLTANVVVAASVTAEGFGTGTLDVLRSATSMTWPVYFDEVLTVADVFFAAVAAALAAFLANRRLTRTEYLALRLWREEQHND